jgi:hypothetical protein
MLLEMILRSRACQQKYSSLNDDFLLKIFLKKILNSRTFLGSFKKFHFSSFFSEFYRQFNFWTYYIVHFIGCTFQVVFRFFYKLK